MKLLRNNPGLLLILFALAAMTALPARAQGVATTTVQGTVYQASGAPGSGTVQLSWPAFTTAAGQAITAGRITATIGSDGFLSVNLAPNLGSMPAGLYYTVVYHLSDGTTSTEYWVVPAAAQATLAQVRAQVMPAAQAVQAVNKSYVDQSIQELAQSMLTASGGNLSGPLYLSGDPTAPTQAADKHYVDTQFAQAVPSGGGVVSGPLTAAQLGAIYQADQFSGTDFGSRLQACLNGLNTNYGGTCDARNFAGSLTMAANLTIAAPNVTVYLPCSTITTSKSIIVPAGTRNVTLHGCASRGTSAASGTQGGTVFLYSGSAALFQIGDSTYAADTLGFHIDNVAINTTSATAATAQAMSIWRTQELSLASLYLLGNSNQTGITLDGTGNYTGGTLQDIDLTGFLTAINAIGHQISNPATTDWLNASTFVRLHVDCPTANGNPISGTTGINLQAGDGNTFTGGDIESCATALHLGPNAQNNTIVGLRNENSTSQVVADAGSAYNNWMTGGTMFTGKLTDNGTRNSFLDTFHRSFNGLNGDWYGSQQDATLTNHYRLGIGSGNERGIYNRYQTDYGYRWTTGLSDATAGEQFYQVLDELNSVYRISIGQYNSGQSSTNNQTVINSAGTGAVVLNGSTNSGTGGVVFGAGGSGATVATIDKSGNAQFNGTLLVGGTSQSSGTMTVRNNADSEVDYYLWPGLTASQKASYTYKDFNGASQWYMVKDSSNNWALNSALGGLDSFKAYQSTNSGDTYINASNNTGTVRINYETGSGSAFNIYGGNSSTLYAGFSGTTSIKFPGLAASTGHNCLQIDNSGWITNTGAACSSGVGTVGSGSSGQIAYYTANGTSIAGLSTVPLANGGTGATTAAAALAHLLPGITSDGANGMGVQGNALVTGALSAQGAVAFPALAASSSSYCVQIDTAGNLTNTGAGCGTATSVPAAGLAFSDASVQTTSQQGALSGSANDATARSAAATAQGAAISAQSAVTAETTRAQAAEAAAQSTASAAQATAGSAQSAAGAAQVTANAALPANGCSTAPGATLNCSALTAGTTASGIIANVSHPGYYAGSDCAAKIAAAQAVWTGAGVTFELDQNCTTFASSPALQPGQNLNVIQPGTYTLNAPLNAPVSATPGVPSSWRFDGGGAATTFVRNFAGGAVIQASGTTGYSSPMVIALPATTLPAGSLSVTVANGSGFPQSGNFWVILSDNSDTSGGYCQGWSVQSNYSCNMEMREGSISGNTIGFLSATTGTYTAGNNPLVTLVTPVKVDLRNISLDSTAQGGPIVVLRYCVDSTVYNLSAKGGAGPDTQAIMAELCNGLDISGPQVRNQDGQKITGSLQVPIVIATSENFHVHDILLRNVGEGVAVEDYSRHGDIGPIECQGVGDDCANTHGNNDWAIRIHDFDSSGCATNAGAASCSGIVVGNGTSAPPDHDIIVENGLVSGYQAFGVEIDGNINYRAFPGQSSPPASGISSRNVTVSNVKISDPMPAPGGTAANTLAALFVAYTDDVTVTNVSVRNVQCGQSGFEILAVNHPHFASSGVVQEQTCTSGTTFGWYLAARGSTAQQYIANGEFRDLWSWGTDSSPYYISSTGNYNGTGYIDHVSFTRLLGATASGSSANAWPASANMTNSPRTQIGDGTNDYASAALTNVASINGQSPFNPAQAYTFGASTLLTPIALAGDPTRGRCMEWGTINGDSYLCTRYSTGDFCLVTNAHEDQENADHWTQDYALAASSISCVSKTLGEYSDYAPAGQAAGTWTSFWTTGGALQTQAVDTAGNTSIAGVLKTGSSAVQVTTATGNLDLSKGVNTLPVASLPTLSETWSPMIFNTIVSASNYAQKHFAVAATATRFEVYLQTAPVNCSTSYAVISLYDSTSSTTLASIPLTSGSASYDSGAISASIAAGDLVFVKVSTAASGCATNASNANITVTYHN